MALQETPATGELLKLTNISVGYGEFWALKNIYLTLAHAEIHAIVGEHGAGKSSLGLMLSGLVKPQIGRITFAGQDYRALTLKTALKLGIAMVQQHALALNPYFSVADNLALDSAPPYRRWRKRRSLQAAQAFLDRHHIPLDAAVRVNTLPLQERVFVDILKRIYAQPRLLILDEALEKLSAVHFTMIVNMLREFTQAGMALLLITHRIDDIYNLADRVSIIKQGEILVTDAVRNIDKLNLIKMAYTQIAKGEKSTDLNQEFYHLLKYNEAILRNLPVNLMVTDKEHRIKLVNDYGKQFFRLEETAYLNVPLDRFFAPNNAHVLALFKDAFSQKQERTFYQIPLTVNAINIISNLKIFPIYDGTFLIGHIIIIEDVTEYDQLQKQVMLSEKLASVGLLAAGVAHEINNPLEIIYNYLSYIKYNFQGPELHAAIDNVHEEIASIAHIVSNLHAFSDQKQAINEELELNEAIRKMLELIRYNAKHQRIAIHFEPSPGNLAIRANKNEIKQVLLNLLKNSFEAMPAGGEIFLITALLSENGAPRVQLTFRDTGPGIGDANPNNIFLPFYSTKKGAANNLGLGLSVSYGIIKKYNGTIAVQNLTPAGCQFTIRLPQMDTVPELPCT